LREITKQILGATQLLIQISIWYS